MVEPWRRGTRYTPEFKAKAVRLLTESRGSYPSETKAIEQVARDPEVAAETLGRWRDKTDAMAVYGYRKTHARSSARGRDPAGIGCARVTNVMRESGIRSVRRGRTPVVARPAKGTGGGPDLVERGFEAESPNRPHVADVAYVRMANGSFGHTAFAADVFARMIAGRACATAMDTGGCRCRRWNRRYHGPPRMAARTVSCTVPAMARGASALCTSPGSGNSACLPPTGTVGDSYGNTIAGSADGAYRTELVWRRKPFRDLRDLKLATFRRISWRGLEASAPALGPQDTGTDRNRVSCKPSGASRPTIRAEQKSGHIAKAQQWIAEGSRDDFILHSALDWNLVLDLAGGALSNCSNIQIYKSNNSAAQHWKLDSSNYTQGAIVIPLSP